MSLIVCNIVGAVAGALAASAIASVVVNDKLIMFTIPVALGGGGAAVGMFISSVVYSCSENKNNK